MRKHILLILVPLVGGCGTAGDHSDHVAGPERPVVQGRPVIEKPQAGIDQAKARSDLNDLVNAWREAKQAGIDQAKARSDQGPSPSFGSPLPGTVEHKSGGSIPNTDNRPTFKFFPTVDDLKRSHILLEKERRKRDTPQLLDELHAVTSQPVTEDPRSRVDLVNRLGAWARQKKSVQNA